VGEIVSSHYSFLEEDVPRTVIRYGHRWETTHPEGTGSMSATRNKKQAEDEARAYTRKERVLERNRGGFWRWKAIIVPYHAKKDRPGFHKKGEKFYLVYIRKYVSES
jgi:hypothetical protein